MKETIDKKLLEHILTDRIESYQKMKRELHSLSYENKKIYQTRIDSMYHVIEILIDTNKWIRNMGEVKLEKLGLNIEDYENS